ncbi:hypothetical protein RsTz2092_03740 [Deferribacterales bacterium RsTz2092]|nr:hypothetical protein AGMMS49941_02460 [Deferribacterales bacterium]
MPKLDNTALFEISWEVCNKVGGIYAVVSSKALEATEAFGENYFLMGPDLGNTPEFTETDEPIWNKIRPAIQATGVNCRFGRWNIPGEPKVILVQFRGKYNNDQILFGLWNDFGVDSLSGGWDYLEPVMFSTACGEVIAAAYREMRRENDELKAIAHAHEWMCGAGLLYLKKNLPDVATVFTTHATMLGRSLAGSGFDIYKQMAQVNPKQEASNHNITAKCSMESTSAKIADCFTTVGKITADESTLFLGRTPDVLTLNGLDMRVIDNYSIARNEPEKYRAIVLNAASKLLREEMPTDTRIFVTSGRYEFHNKGVDLFLDSLAELNKSLSGSNTKVLVICSVMGGHNGVNPDAISGDGSKFPEYGGNWLTSHYLQNQPSDHILNACKRLGLDNKSENNVKFIFVPAMLDGNDGFLNLSYYNLLAASDLGVFPSWYEPWGYTPEESIAYSVPTVTTDLAGFGIWVREAGSDDKRGVHIISRKQTADEEVLRSLVQVLKEYSLIDFNELTARRKIAHDIAQNCSWEQFFPYYISAYGFALDKAADRTMTPEETKSSHHVWASNVERPHLRSFNAVADLPSKVSRLRELAYNLWWTWNPACWDLFSDLNREMWEKSRHNPVAVIKHTSAQRYEVMARDSVYMRLYRDTMEEFDKYMSIPIKSYDPLTANNPLAYFSTEYGIHESLAIYSGGLGVLSGDHLKSASDLAAPLVALGLFYRNGYFRQQIDKSGRQVAVYPENDFNMLPATLVKDEKGNPIKISIQLPGRMLYAQAWMLTVGRIQLYLLDSDIPDNTSNDRYVTARLYEADRDFRIRQEMLLGMGGVKLLRVLGIRPSGYHMNEGHSAFMTIERIIHLMQNDGMSYEAAGEYVRSDTIFTTHTPIDAGNEVFTLDKVAQYFSGYAQQMGISWQRFLNMGRFEGNDRHVFEMTVLALKYSFKANGVSALHGHVSRQMWQHGFPRISATEVPIASVTNGIHVDSYAGPQMRKLLHRELGEGWSSNTPDSDVWNKIDAIPDERIWTAKQAQKAHLLDTIKVGLPAIFKKYSISYDMEKRMLAGLDPNALVICFARRFAPYKRANLLFADPERLLRIIGDNSKPVIFVFAGKAHPADTQGADILQNVIQHMLNPSFAGKVYFVENYDLQVSRDLTQGCNVWLNTPRRPYEASGTSGQKVPVNGGLNLSISDGWWVEGYNGTNGWTIGPVVGVNEIVQEQNDYNDASSLYDLLEDQLIPLYFNRSTDGLPHGWIEYMKNSMKTLTAEYSSTRMVSDYMRDYYIPAANRKYEVRASDKLLAKRIAEWKSGVVGRFSSVNIAEMLISDVESEADMHIGQEISLRVTINPGDMRPDELLVQLVVGIGNGNEFFGKPDVLLLKQVDAIKNRIIYKGTYAINREGKHIYGIRVFPTTKGLASPLDTGLVLWG